MTGSGRDCRDVLGAQGSAATRMDSPRQRADSGKRAAARGTRRVSSASWLLTLSPPRVRRTDAGGVTVHRLLLLRRHSHDSIIGSERQPARARCHVAGLLPDAVRVHPLVILPPRQWAGGAGRRDGRADERLPRGLRAQAGESWQSASHIGVPGHWDRDKGLLRPQGHSCGAMLNSRSRYISCPSVEILPSLALAHPQPGSPVKAFLITGTCPRFSRPAAGEPPFT